MNDGYSETEVVEKIINENLFQYPTEKEIKKLARACVSRWTVPRLTDKEKSAQSQNSGELHGLAPDFKRSEAVLQVDPLIVAELHILRYRLFDFSPARKFSPIQALCFQCPEKIFHCRIVDALS